MRRRPITLNFGTLKIATLALVTLSSLAFGWTLLHAAPPTAEQKTKITAATTALTKAGNLFNNKKFPEAATAVGESQKLLTELATGADKDLQKQIEPLWTKLKNAHSLLELEGIKVEPLTIPAGAPDPVPGEKPATPGTKPVVGAKPAVGGAKISFTKQVFPMLMAKCGKCHCADSKGGFNFATFAALEKGNKDGRVIIPGKGEGSRIVETIASGDMPRGGGKVGKDEMAMLTKWIDDGAVFDGANKTAMLTVAPGTAVAAEPAPMKLEVARATGKETVSFSKDIAPIIAANCIGCHGDQNPGGRLNLDAFDTLIKGGESGAPFKPGTPAESLLVRKLKGMAGKRMPLDKPALPADAIAKVEKWIAEGGKFDSILSPGEKLARLVAVVKAQSASHEELVKDRKASADKVWKQALPDDKPERLETKNFYILGDTNADANMEQIGEIAEKQVEAVAKTLHAPTDGPLVKGKMTIFICKNRIEFEEFLHVTEKREITPDVRSSWKFDAIEAYAVVLPSADKKYGLAPLLAQQIASVYTAAMGRTPMWFAEGAGRVVATKVEPKDARSVQFDQQLASAASRHGGDSVVNGGIGRDDLNALSYGFVKSQLMGSTTNFAALMKALREGQEFDAAVSKVYRATPLQLATAWGKKK